jgi:hypothetical protein
VKLEWNQMPDGTGELASGDDWVYLIAADDRAMVLTRWEVAPAGLSRSGVARQAALFAIRIGGAFDAVPEAGAALAAHMRDTAQQYESGIDVTGQPAWWHGYQLPERTQQEK